MNRRRFISTAATAGALLGRGICRAETPAQGRAGEHLVYTWKGSPFDVGRQHGQALKDEITAEAAPALKSLTEFRKCSEAQALDWMVAEYEPLYRKLVPSALEEVRGMAQGAGLGYPFAFFAAFRDGMGLRRPPPEPGCTTVLCGRKTTAGGKVLIGQTKDTGPAPLTRFRIMRIAYDSGRRVIILNYPGWLGNLCLTSDGLGQTGNSLYGREPHVQTVPFSLFRRLVVEKSSVDDVLAAIAPYHFENGCLSMGDARGRLVCIEELAGRRGVLDVSDQAFGHANSILCPELKSFEDSGDVFGYTKNRQQRAQQLLDEKRGAITPQDVQKIFADHHDEPRNICRHAAAGATTAAFVANLTDLQMDIAIGNPCVAGFRRYTMDF
jgi:isopenicillin-N N-acyltransferase-like protein